MGTQLCRCDDASACPSNSHVDPSCAKSDSHHNFHLYVVLSLAPSNLDIAIIEHELTYACNCLRYMMLCGN